jgi:quercetin dioxygenase-like cupin family protein
MAALFTDGEPGGPAGAAQTSRNGAKPPPARVVRKDQRKTLAWPGRPWKTYLLTPDVQGELEVLLNELQPGATIDDAYTHEGEEFGFVLEGSYEVTVGGAVYVLEEGDSISYSSRIPHKMRVVGDRPSRSIWVITPPSF